MIENPQIGEIRHIGLINEMELVNNKETKEAYDPKLRIAYEVYKKALKKGLILRPLGNVLYFRNVLSWFYLYLILKIMRRIISNGLEMS